MNHFVGLMLLSLCVASVFTFVNPEAGDEPVRYFFKLLAYMIVGSLVFAWLMAFIV